MLHLDEEFPPGVCPWLVALCGEDVAHAEDRTPGRAIYRKAIHRAFRILHGASSPY